MEHGFAWVEAIPGLSSLPAHTATALIVALVLVGLALAARRGFESSSKPLVPDGRLSARELFEVVTAWLADLADGLIGHHGRDYVPFFATIFLFILCSNLIGLVPGFVPPTDNFNTTFGLDEPMGCYEDIDHAHVFVLWGANMAENHPVLFSRLLERRQARPDVRIVDLAARTTRTSYAAGP